ncbi:hypothetical protein HVX06_22095 (plasmid) [Enterobacter sp. RHB15-C17]|nr:hypothetical protein HVX06_22095 [Enterobacter sp. RHB15-C17]
MFNLILLSQNHFLDNAVTDTVDIIANNKLVKDWSHASLISTRHVITLNDINPLNSLLRLAAMKCFEEGDIVIILSNFVMEKLARRFITVRCRLICLPQKSSVEALKNILVTRYAMDNENLKVKNTTFLHQREKKLLLSIRNGVSTQAITEDFCLSVKNVSACKICIMGKMGLTKKMQLLQIINSRDLHQAMSFL